MSSPFDHLLINIDLSWFHPDSPMDEATRSQILELRQGILLDLRRSLETRRDAYSRACLRLVGEIQDLYVDGTPKIVFAYYSMMVGLKIETRFAALPLHIFGVDTADFLHPDI
jgi:hypothetical protein